MTSTKPEMNSSSGGVLKRPQMPQNSGSSGQSLPGFARAQRKPATSLANVDIGPHNFKDHFDSDILDYVTEDVRLSTLQRKLVRENNTLVSHALACQVCIF